MKSRFRKKIHFGLGFSCPVEFKDMSKADDRGLYSKKNYGGPIIEVDNTEPIWDQLQTYSHEILHAAIDFDLYVRGELIPQLKKEAEETAKHLEDD